ncbi:hypothetical protein L249_2754 [Ophiocordyceps polyrhachis-furcata BCC 54312]|uniref:Trafficking protein particle complex subunit 11 domain-containing protein n=1 Tax=Ophiocordyceps polyrhachis-furcata BCC 54312 TaxID=1330021 RepID=A0A367LN02_9HYPO|nr:hypothetical protein L249_2754 [Ophiocordyceps polyrhachis-furcata BCC 54312]
MDGYPAGCLDHNAPFIVVSGLSAQQQQPEPQSGVGLEDGRLLLRSSLPLLDDRLSAFLVKYFAQVDAHGMSWTTVSRQEPYRFRIKTVDRSFSLPPRRAQVPQSEESIPSAPLHSPFSPLSPASALYPDGLMDSKWIRKHQDMVPAIYACFYTLEDDVQLKADINDLKSTLAKSGYKVRVVIILLGDATGGSVQERLESIRKGTALDPKSIFYISKKSSAVEIKRTLDGILTALYSTAVEYYRDLGRHARKKRSRGIAPQPTVPPTTGTSRILSLPDWNFRYDFKAAVFAEFRQEMDAASRSFEQAYEILLGQDVLDTIPSWSPRWNEARLLADVISIRCVRIQLWMGHTSLAVRRWQSHRDRISDVVDRRGRGTNNYGWQAWEARWATVMAQLMERVSIPGLTPASMTLFLQPDKVVLGERLKPWELLHHTGYWYRLAARHLDARRALARTIPDDVRHAPVDSPSSPSSSSSSPPPPSKSASKAYAYDTYLCPVPYREYPLNGQGVNHAQLIIDCLLAARSQFQARDQHRLAAEVALECAREMASLAAWDDMLALLQPLYDAAAFRSDGWVHATEELCWLLRQAAVETGHADLVVAVDWELMNRKFSRRHRWHYDLIKSLDGIKTSSKPIVSLSDDASPAFVSASFVFLTKESKAGEKCAAQLALYSAAMPGSVPITFSSLRVELTGSLKPVVIEHAASGKDADAPINTLLLDEEFAEAAADETPSQLRGRCDLTLKPGQRRVLEAAIPLRAAGLAEATSLTFYLNNDSFDLDYTVKFRETDDAVGWYTGPGAGRNVRPDGRYLRVQPRPPKIRIDVPDGARQFYTDEGLKLLVEISNDEDEAASVKLAVNLMGSLGPLFRVVIDGQERNGEDGDRGATSTTGIPLGTIDSGASRSVMIHIDPAEAPTTHELQLRVSYHLESDTATPIVQEQTAQLSVVTPFEANYDLVSRLQADPWPSPFDADGVLEAAQRETATSDTKARGLAQRWCLECRYASFAVEDLLVLGLDVTMAPLVGGARCRVSKRPQVANGGIVAAPKTMYKADADLEVQKLSLDDRQAVTLAPQLVMRWQRSDAGADGPVNTTTLPVGQYTVLGTEPRVLASVLHETRRTWPGLMWLDITIENPSSHFLTFGLSMEPSDEFALSGAKQTTLHLLPLSRRTTRYRLLPLVRGVYVRPGLVVRDKYFQKVLRVMPTEGMKTDKEGLLVWVPPAVTEAKATDSDSGKLQEGK